MSLTANALYRETSQFFRENLKTVLLISLLSAFVTVLLEHMFLPPADQIADLLSGADSSDSILEVVRNMSPDQQNMLLHTSAVATFSALIGSTLLIGGILRLQAALSQGKTSSAIAAIASSVNVWPRLLIQTCLITLIVQLGFLVLVIPGIILLILLVLSPVMLLDQNKGLVKTMKQSFQLSWANIRLIAPAVLGWLLVKLALNMLAGGVGFMPTAMLSMVLNTLSNLVSALLLIYLYRLYLIIR